jgi:UPF0755 protein
MSQETQPDTYANYDKDFVHIPEQEHHPIEILDKAKTTQVPQVKKTLKHPVLTVIALGILTCIILLVASASYIYIAFTQPVQLEKTPVIIDIPKGTSLQKTTDMLYRAGLIRSPFIFRSSMILGGFDTAIKTGEYTFTESTRMTEVVERLIKGDYRYIPVKLIIREGEDAKTIASYIYTAFPKLSSTTIAERLQEREGKLFPETYMFPPFATEELILQTIESQYTKRIAIHKVAIASSTYSENQILTIASILEREVPKKEDMHIVAGIIYNRLRKNMPLQMDSTLGYFTGKASLELTTEDLQLDSPYNTYKNTGIPPAPIGNPGDASINAALHPDTHQYIFFLSDANGINHYAVTYAEHLKNRKKYLGK